MIKTWNKIRPEQHKILFLHPEHVEGIDGIENCTHLFILEPLANYSQLQQLRARVVRKGSHDDELMITPVEVYEYQCTLQFFHQRLFGMQAVKEWWRNDRQIMYLCQEVISSQVTTPDELNYKRQAKSKNLETNLKKHLKKGAGNKSIELEMHRQSQDLILV